MTLGWVEGLEINLLGAVAGLDLRRPVLKMPGWGRIGLAPSPEPGATAPASRSAASAASGPS